MRVGYLTRHQSWYLAISMLFIAAIAHSASALPTASPTPVAVSIDSAIANQLTDGSRQTGWAVFVTFTEEFDSSDTAQAENPANYRIIDADTGSQVPVSEAKFAPLKLGSRLKLQIIRLVLPSAGALNKGDLLYLFALHLRFKGAPAKSIPMHEIILEPDPSDDQKVLVDEKGTDGTDAHKLPKPAWGLGKSKGKDDSDLYFSYELTKARGVATTGTGDLKISVPFYKNFWHKTSKFSPVVAVKASSDASADPDSLKFAFEWSYPLHLGNNPNAKFPYVSSYWINAGKIEAPKNFNNINAIWESRLWFPSTQIPHSGKHLKMFLDVFVGSELGKNLKSPLRAVEGKGLARIMTGADLALQIPINNLTALKGFEFDSSYIRRWPLKRELLVDKDANGNMIPLAVSKGPKDYSDSKFIIKVNDYFGPYIGYEWGRLPPNYELVDHKWTFGLLFKAKVKAGGE